MLQQSTVFSDEDQYVHVEQATPPQDPAARFAQLRTDTGREQQSPTPDGDGDPFNITEGVLSDEESALSQSTITSGSLDDQDDDQAFWNWSPEHNDFILWKDGKLLQYKVLQKSGSSSARDVEDTQNLSGPEKGRSSPRNLNSGPLQVSERPRPARGPGPGPGPGPGTVPTPIPRAAPVPAPLRPFDQQLDKRFRVVDKPKRFFTVGRIFKVVWFEPGGQLDIAAAVARGPPSRRADLEYTRVCPAFYTERPYAKFRWFVVVRKRLHHSLCFAITTFGGRGAVKASKGRSRDFVVLYPAAMDEPPPPYPEENIERDPVAVIIEDSDQYISPLARLDCGRIYTVEDNLKVMKIGRVHPESLNRLEEYYRESVR